MKIICIGKNYVNHAKEMGSEVPKEPLFFLKPDSAILPKKHPFFIPNFSREIHYELELLIIIKKLGKHIGKKFASSYYSEIGLGIDFTARDLQNDLKKKGLPWEAAKSFDGSAVVGTFIKKNQFDINNLNFSLKKNGIIVQNGNSKSMINNFNKIISYISNFITLKKGDLIFTGTPSGVSVVKENDILEGFLENIKLLETKII